MEIMHKRDCFDILGVSREASLEEAKRSYKELVKRWHPDQFGNDPEKQQIAQDRLKEINVAYRELISLLKSSAEGIKTQPKVKTPKEPERHGGRWDGSERSSLFRKIGRYLKKQVTPPAGNASTFSEGVKMSQGTKPKQPSGVDKRSGGPQDFGKALRSAIKNHPHQGAGGNANAGFGGGGGRRRCGRIKRTGVSFRQAPPRRNGPVEKIQRIRPVGRVKKIGE